jgi:NTE family protein
VLEPGRGGRPRELIRGASPAETLARVARHLAGGTVGLALGAGGAFGFAHIGLLHVLETAGVPVDYVAGTSMGAVIGSALAAGVSADRMRTFATNVAGRFRWLVLRDLNPRGPSLLGGTSPLRVLREIDELREATFDGLLVPFVAVATDLANGEAVLLEAGPVLDTIRASFAMPGIFPACIAGGRTLIDGAMVDPVPVDVTRALGADFVIAAHVIPPLQPTPQDPVGGVLGRARRLADVLPLRRVCAGLETLEVTLRSFQALWCQLASASALRADAVIRPELGRYWYLQFGDAPAIIETGAEAGEAALASLRAALTERVGLVLDPTRGASPTT